MNLEGSDMCLWGWCGEGSVEDGWVKFGIRKNVFQSMQRCRRDNNYNIQ